MATDFSELLIENDTHHSDLETTLLGLSSGDLSSVLTASDHNVELLEIRVVVEGADRSSSAWLNKVEYSNLFESAWIQKFGSTVSAASDQHGVIVGDCE